MQDGRPGPESEKDKQPPKTRAEFGGLPGNVQERLEGAQQGVVGKKNPLGRVAIPGAAHPDVPESTRDVLPGLILTGADPAAQQEMHKRLTSEKTFVYSGPGTFIKDGESWRWENSVATALGFLTPPILRTVSHLSMAAWERAFGLSEQTRITRGKAAELRLEGRREEAARLTRGEKAMTHPISRLLRGLGFAYVWNGLTEQTYKMSQENNWANRDDYLSYLGHAMPYFRPNPVSSALIGLSMYYRWWPTRLATEYWRIWDGKAAELKAWEKAAELGRPRSALSDAAKAARGELRGAKQAEAAAAKSYRAVSGGGRGGYWGPAIFVGALGTEALYNTFVRADDTKDPLREAWEKDKTQRSDSSMKTLFDELCKLGRAKPAYLKAHLTNEQRKDYAPDLALGNRRQAMIATAFGITELERGSLVRVSSFDHETKWDDNAKFLPTGNLDLGGIATDHLVPARKKIKESGGGLDDLDKLAKEKLDLIYGEHNIPEIFKALVSMRATNGSTIAYDTLNYMYVSVLQRETAQFIADQASLPERERDYQRMAKRCRDVALLGLAITQIRAGAANNDKVYNHAMNWLDLATKQKGHENHPDARQLKQVGEELGARLGLRREPAKDPLEVGELERFKILRDAAQKDPAPDVPTDPAKAVMPKGPGVPADPPKAVTPKPPDAPKVYTNPFSKKK